MDFTARISKAGVLNMISMCCKCAELKLLNKMNNVEELCDGGHILPYFMSKILIPFSDLAAALILI